MKNIRFIYVVFCLAVLLVTLKSTYSQNRTHSIDWSRCYGGSRDENESIRPGANFILPLPDGGYIFAGGTQSIDGDIDKSKRRDDTFIKDSCINDDIWIVKLSQSGQIEWEKYFGGSLSDFVFDIKPTSDGGYILCGLAGSINGDFPFDTTGVVDVYVKAGTNDGFVMKLDSAGDKQWMTRIGGSGYDGLESVIETSDGGFAAVGYSSSTDELWQGLSWIRHQGPLGDGLLVKLNSKGEKKWSRRYGGTKLESFRDLVETAEGGFILCGGTDSEDGDVSSLHYIDSVNKLGGTPDVWIVEVNNTGQLTREKCFGGTGSEGADNLHSLANGEFVVVAGTSSSDVDVVGFHPIKTGLSYGAFDAWIFQIDTGWNITWQNCIGGSQQDVVNTLIPTNSGGYAFIGYTNSSDSDLTNIHSPEPEHNWDLWVGELSDNGKLLWHECYGGTKTDYGNGIVENTDGSFTLYGSVGSTDGDIVGNHGGSAVHNRDIWVAKLKQKNSVESSSGDSHFANPFPNPTGNQMNLYIHPSEPVERVEFFNPLGQQFYPSYRVSGNLLSSDITTLSAGIYFIRITYKNLSTQEVRKFVVGE